MMRQTIQHRKILRISLIAIMLFILILAVTFSAGQLAWADSTAMQSSQGSPLHPPITLLDEYGVNVLDSGGAVSTMKTCGSCHDTAFIVEHSYHADLGLSDLSDPGQTPSERPWDISSGLFGRWNPLIYRYLSPQDDQIIDLTTPGWIQTIGPRHVGGGPAEYSRDGVRLTELEYDPDDLETNSIDPETGALTPWDWEASGVVEMNCFLCHMPAPNNEARLDELHAGNFRWANTATLIGSELVERIGDDYRWNPAAFNEDGEVTRDILPMQDPTNENCGLCHGLVHAELEDPLAVSGCAPERWRTVTTGQIISPQRISNSGMNIADKEEISRAWDVHAERLVQCTDCHFSLNNPIYHQEGSDTQPDHLTFDPRRLEIGEYLYQPLHQFARGDSATSEFTSEVQDRMRGCESCHSIDATHEWLPYQERHVEAMSCETCHIPAMYSNASQQIDWTVVEQDGSAETRCRGVEDQGGTFETLITGFQPVLLPTEDLDGNLRLMPHNLSTAWFWVYGDPERPVRQEDVVEAWLDGEYYHPEIIALFDNDGDQNLDSSELIINSPEKESLIAGRLAAIGLENPHIVGEIQPYSINHDVATGDWAIKDCRTCHSQDSLVKKPFKLASYIPGGVIPEFVKDAQPVISGDLVVNDDGELWYEPQPDSEGYYVLGLSNVSWIDLLGSLIFLSTLVVIAVHASYRLITSLRNPKEDDEVSRVYMYSIYERLWHWLQTFTIVTLIFTGLIIHKPDTFGLFDFRGVVLVHNVLAVILLINAGLALFYHLASGEIQQYLPRPRGFFDMAISQAIYYVRGIFKNEPHPFEKTSEKKLNPLQQVTYFGILNVLLPLQIITGILMWGAQRWPELTASLGGLPFLAPFHTLIAWLFATFVVFHVYLTTTGYKPWTSINAMINGWDEIEVHHESREDSNS